LEQFIVHDQSDRYKESSVWTIQGLEISLNHQYQFRMGRVSMGGSTDVFDGICFSVECKQDRSAHAPAQEDEKDDDNIMETMKGILKNIGKKFFDPIIPDIIDSF
jgi:hypothetical protein